MTGNRPLLVSADTELIDDVLRLAAANGVEVHLATEAESARSRWQLAPLVLVGGDVAAAVAGSGMGRRRGVVLVSRAASADDWQRAVALGVEHVVSLPEGERWLIDQLADTSEGVPRDGAVIAVLGSGGGAGASTFAATLAVAAGARGLRVLLVDGDRTGGGLDVLLGMEDAAGIRWPDLVEARGRLGTAAFDQGLPHVGTVAVLSMGRGAAPVIPTDVLASVLDTGVRAYDLVVVDVPRHLDEATELFLSRADHGVVVITNRVRAAAAATPLIASVETRCNGVGVVLRSEPKGVSDDAILAAVAAPLVARLPTAAAVAARADAGEPPALRDAYGRAVQAALRALAPRIGRVPEDRGDRRLGGRRRVA